MVGVGPAKAVQGGASSGLDDARKLAIPRAALRETDWEDILSRSISSRSANPSGQAKKKRRTISVFALGLVQFLRVRSDEQRAHLDRESATRRLDREGRRGLPRYRRFLHSRPIDARGRAGPGPGPPRALPSLRGRGSARFDHFPRGIHLRSTEHFSRLVRRRRPPLRRRAPPFTPQRDAYPTTPAPPTVFLFPFFRTSLHPLPPSSSTTATSLHSGTFYPSPRDHPASLTLVPARFTQSAPFPFSPLSRNSTTQIQHLAPRRRVVILKEVLHRFHESAGSHRRKERTFDEISNSL